MIPTIWDKKNITDCDVVELVETDLTNAWYFGLVSESPHAISHHVFHSIIIQRLALCYREVHRDSKSIPVFRKVLNALLDRSRCDDKVSPSNIPTNI